MYRTLPAVIAMLLASVLAPIATAAEHSGVKIAIESIATPAAQVQGANGERGAALATLADGRLLLGGGATGFDLFLFDVNSRKQSRVGRVGFASERINDSRFAVTDIAILNQGANSAELLISYPRYSRSDKCVSVMVYAYKAEFGARPSLKKGRLWFESKPCVPISAVQHASGRMEVIDKGYAYLTIGDLGYPEIGNKSKRGDLGAVFKISASAVEQISEGHRSTQGIVLIGKDLYTSEHGPRGGDELNLIQSGGDYGWPHVSYGQPYTKGDYVSPTLTGSHEGYKKPLYNWVPSVAPTELIQLPAASMWGGLSSQIVMGTLKAEVLIFIQMQGVNTVGRVQSVKVGERVRDLDLLPSGQLVATTDSGKLLVIKPQN